MVVIGTEHLNDMPQLDDMSMYEMVRRAAEANPRETALIFLGNQYTFGDLMSEVHKCARSLKALGLSDGDILAIAMPNCPQAVFMVYAANSLGVVCEMIHPLSSPREICDNCNMVGAKLLLVLDSAVDLLSSVLSDICVERVICTSLRYGLGAFKGFLFSLKEHSTVPDHPKILKWKEFLGRGAGIPDPCFNAGSDHPAVILLSGGTTGVPKGVLHRNSAFNANGVQTKVTVAGSKPLRFLAVMPIFHGFGLGQSVHCPLSVGWSTVLMPRFHPEDYCDNLQRYRCSLLCGTPSMFEALVASRLLEGKDLGFVFAMFSGGDLLTDDKYRRIKNGFGNCDGSVIRQGYGLAESIAAVCVTPGAVKHNCIGSPYFGNLMTVVVPGTVEECREGEEGEICVCGPTTMVRYIGCPEETSSAFMVHADGRTWLHTGDIGRITDGEVYFISRKSRLIISNGYNIYPSQVENVFDRHEKVRMSYAMPVKDERKGEVIRVCIILRNGLEPTPEIRAELKAYAKENFARYAQPAQYVFLKEFPQTRVGKVDGRALAALCEQMTGDSDES